MGIHGVARPREWDAVSVVRVELDGDRAAFVALPDGTLVVEDGPDDVAGLAAGVERTLAPPYRAEAVLRPDGTWSVGARTIRVAELPRLQGDEVTLAIGDGGTELVVDDQQTFGSAPELEAMLTGARGVVRAHRIDGAAFEVEVHTL